jgi:hypothetical protein
MILLEFMSIGNKGSIGCTALVATRRGKIANFNHMIHYLFLSSNFSFVCIHCRTLRVI